ncbi:MAG: metallophosphoesterase family protein [Clostridia bacterium]|nr:metallophosphoesterase family protein [Clostridia bacterium]
MFKKVLSVFMSVVLLCSCAAVAAYAKTSEEVDTHLQFGEDGKFRIMQISDMQDFFPMKSITKNVIKKALDTYPVDLIVLTGDNISSTSVVKPYAALAINEFMSIYEKYGIPVVMVYGNHDDENTTADKAYQMSVYERYKCFIGCAGEDFGESNLGTYYVPIYSSTDKNKMVNNIWMIDSGTYNNENDLGGYGCVTKKQVEWYKTTSEKLERENGGKIPSLMFQHIVVPEIWDALDEHDGQVEGCVEHGGKYYTLPEGAKGTLGETPCPPNYTNGQFDAVLERGDVMAMFFGHDHVNTYEVSYKGVDLCNTPGVGFRSYNSIDEGVRLITLDENSPDTYETEVVSYFDLFDENDEVAYNQFMSESRIVDDSEHFGYFIKYLIALIKTFFNFG